MSQEREPLRAVLRCPFCGGEWPATDFECFLEWEGRRGKQGMSTISFACPLGHVFNLEKAVEAGMFTRAQAQTLIVCAQGYVDEMEGKDSDSPER
jgi:hypothetical protein